LYPVRGSALLWRHDDPLPHDVPLVFAEKQRTVPVVDQPWYRNLFHHRQPQQPATTATKADCGDAEAQFSLGQEFEQAEGIPANHVEAAACYRRAASRNHASAQFNLGIMLSEGRGAARDDDEARHWILQAAQQGHAAAQHNLGVRCRRASFNGCTKDAAESNLEAYMWFWLASAQGYQGSAGELENLTLRMTHEEVLEGEQRVAKFVSRSTPPRRGEEPGRAHRPT
jgi:TPR repeat protein